MSVRRLAEATDQPAGFAFTEANTAWAEATIRKYPEGRQQSAVIPLLMRAQDQDGWVTKAAIEHVAERLDMPLIRVLEVATFYTQFQLNPVGTKAHIQVCGTTPCMLRGAEDLKAVCRKKIHSEQFHRNETGSLSWEEVECLGACVNAPMVMIFEDTYEDLTPERLEEIIDLFDAGQGSEVKPGPQNGRHLSAPLGGLTSLTGEYDDLIAEQHRSAGQASANGAAGKSASANAPTTPSEAARPDTESEMTDPTIKSPGNAVGASVDEGTEVRESDELTAKGHRPGAGQEGGARRGSTDAEVGNVPDETDTKTQGKLRSAEAAAEAIVIPADRQLDDGTGGQPPRLGADANPRDVLSGKRGDDLTEGARTETADVMAGPTAKDHFESRAEATAPESRPGEKPTDLLSAPKGDKDDLKKIKGVGPIIEGKLNDLGVFHFWQIAKWREAELYWIDDFLNFRGRAVREEWIEQAKKLEAGSSSQPGEGDA